MAWLRQWIVAYDVADPRRLKRVAALLEREGQRQQRSVFEVAVDAQGRHLLQHRLRRIVDAQRDHVLLHPVCTRCREGTLWQGKAPGAEHEPFWIV